MSASLDLMQRLAQEMEAAQRSARRTQKCRSQQASHLDML